jgi:hypothetical protein
VAYSIAATFMILSLLDRVYAVAAHGEVTTLEGTEASHTLSWLHAGIYVLGGITALVVLAEIVAYFVADDRTSSKLTKNH